MSRGKVVAGFGHNQPVTHSYPNMLPGEIRTGISPRTHHQQQRLSHTTTATTTATSYIASSREYLAGTKLVWT